MLSRHQSLSRALLLPRPVISHTWPFHTTSTWRSEAVNYYETLGVDPKASAAAVKKQFYSLSKNHHPDRNLDDPQASERFVKISEAYAVLGSPHKRERYDRDVQRAQNSSPPQARRGSHSSSSAPFGSRPASGLSRRRTQFKGPPPSFYRSGGWGQQGHKRQSQAAASGSTYADEPRGGGFGPGQRQAGSSTDVPHFDRDGHHRTQEQQDQRRRRRLQDESVGHNEGGSILVKFVVTSAVVAFAVSIPASFESTVNKGKRKDEL